VRVIGYAYCEVTGRYCWHGSRSRRVITEKGIGWAMSDVHYLTIAILANEKEATESLRRCVGHLQWGGINVIAGGVDSE